MFTQASQPQMWDKKASQYGRLSHHENSFQKQILSKIAARGIHFHAKSVLDVGCGTGIYTLHIAQEALHVNALDFSGEMLALLNEDAKREGLHSKLTLTCKTWEAFEAPETFEILFCSMSPALRSDADFQKFHDLAHEHCIYLGWAGKRESTLLDPIFQAHDLPLKAPPGAEPLKAWLHDQKIDYEREYIEEKRLHVKPYEEALASVLWHLEINQTLPQLERIQELLAPLNHNNTIAFETNIGVELIPWKK